MIRRLGFAILLLAGIYPVVNLSKAASTTGSLSVSATVGNTCTVGASTLAFGSITQGAAANATGSIALTCTSGAPYTIDLSGGNNPSPTPTQRELSAPQIGLIRYDLYQDSGHMTLWGTAVLNGVVENGTGTGAAQSIPVYGAIAPQAFGAGTYTDTVTITVSF